MQLGTGGGRARVSREMRGVRVLVIEDNHDAASSLAMLLGLPGHHVAVAYDGEDALVAAHRDVPDVMLTDIGLPGIDGYEVARRVRRDPLLAKVALVALTGYDELERARAAGFDD